MASQRFQQLMARAKARHHAIMSSEPVWDDNSKALLRRLTTLQDCKQAYHGNPRGELFIHWFYRQRKEDRLSRCEIFHLNMLQWFDVMDRVEVIHVRCASPNLSPTAAMLHAIHILSQGRAKVDFKCVLPRSSWEHDTIKEAAEYALETGKFVYYTHFKGVSRVEDSLFGDIVRKGYGSLDVFYWTWILYKSLFEAPEYAQAIGPIYRTGINKSYVQKNIDISWSELKGNPKYYVGSFQGFDGKLLRAKCEKLGLADAATRNKKLWVNDPYTVEMFLSLMFKPQEVFTSLMVSSISSYNLYSKRMFSRLLSNFKQWPELKRALAPDPISCKYAVLTYAYGDAHSLLREPLVKDDDVRYVCVTDNPDLKPGPQSAWEIVYDPWMEYSGRFKHMQAKFRPFRYVSAEKVLVVDSSIRIIGTLKEVFQLQCPGVLLKRHPVAATIGEELPRWASRGMPPQDMKVFKALLSLVGASPKDPVYELCISLWANTTTARALGEEVLALVEGAGHRNPFMSNQLCASALASKWFKGSVGVFDKPLPVEKYAHGTWKLLKR